MLVKRVFHYFLKNSIYLPIESFSRNIFIYSGREDFFLSFGNLYIKFETCPQKLLAVQEEN